MTAQLPMIGTRFDVDDELWHLTATNYGTTTFAGAALFRARPHPAIQFSHETEAGAKKAAEVLQAYVDANWPKRVSRAKERKTGE